MFVNESILNNISTIMSNHMMDKSMINQVYSSFLYELNEYKGKIEYKIKRVGLPIQIYILKMLLLKDTKFYTVQWPIAITTYCYLFTARTYWEKSRRKKLTSKYILESMNVFSENELNKKVKNICKQYDLRDTQIDYSLFLAKLKVLINKNAILLSYMDTEKIILDSNK